MDRVELIKRNSSIAIEYFEIFPMYSYHRAESDYSRLKLFSSRVERAELNLTVHRIDGSKFSLKK